MPTLEVTGTQVHFLTICTHSRAAIFLDDQIVQSVLLHFLHTSQTVGFALLAYCFMPDHVHLVIEGMGRESELPRWVSLAKQRSGYEFSRRASRRLWQPSYFDRTLRADEVLPEVIRYVINNPIRAGIVQVAEEYPHWGSGVCSRQELLEWIAAVPRG